MMRYHHADTVYIINTGYIDFIIIYIALNHIYRFHIMYKFHHVQFIYVRIMTVGIIW